MICQSTDFHIGRANLTFLFFLCFVSTFLQLWSAPVFLPPGGQLYLAISLQAEPEYCCNKNRPAHTVRRGKHLQ